MIFVFSSTIVSQQEKKSSKKIILQSFVNPAFTREILGSYSNETQYIRKFRPVLSGGIGIKKELKKDKWFLGTGLLYQNYEMSEKSFDLMHSNPKITNTIYKARYLTIPITLSFQKNDILFSLGLTNSYLTNKKTYIDNQANTSIALKEENWLTGFDGKIGYQFNLSEKSSILVELYGNISSYSIYFPKILKYGFEIGYYTFGLSLSYNFRIV